MMKYLAILAAATLASPSLAATFQFDFSGDVLAQTKPKLSVTPEPITGSLTYEAPDSGDVTTLTGNATLVTDLFGTFNFTSYTAMLSDSMFSFAGSSGGQGFSLRLSALGTPGQFGFGGPGDGFALTGEPVNATGRVSGSFAGNPAVPEPATWALMMLAFATIGTLLRRRGAARPLARAA